MSLESPTFSRRFIAALRRNVGPLEITVIALGTVAFIAAGAVDSFEWFFEFTRAHEDWQLDEIANFFAIATVGLTVLLYARTRRLTREISRRISAEMQAAALARHDPLTGIANRRLFNEELDRMASAARRNDGHFAVLLFDLNRFKAVNDIHGHPVGDQLLIAISQRLRVLARKEDVLARFGGDEFALAAADTGKDAALRLASRLVAVVEESVKLGDITLEVGASVGIALYPNDATDPETLIQRADMAMYRAKATRTGHAFFDRAIDEALRDRAVLEADLRAAVGTDAIVPYYQPLVDLGQGTTFGFEMLARWRHPTRGVLPPETFIPIAEDTRLIGELSLDLLRSAVRDATTWPAALMLSVNIAPDQFRDARLAEKVLGVLSAAGFPPHRLEIELTENALVGDLAMARETIDQFKRAGVRIAIDDFGKGYSSLFYLRELPFDVVKIDQSFVGSRRINPESAKIVTAVIGLGEAMGLKTVAEGIEDRLDADWLQAQGCAAGQGFLYSEPVPADQVPALLAPPTQARRDANAA